MRGRIKSINPRWRGCCASSSGLSQGSTSYIRSYSYITEGPTASYHSMPSYPRQKAPKTSVYRTKVDEQAFQYLREASKYLQKVYTDTDAATPSSTQGLLNLHCTLSYAEKSVDALLTTRWGEKDRDSTWTGLPLTSLSRILDQLHEHDVVVQYLCSLVREIRSVIEQRVRSNQGQSLQIDPLTVRRLVSLSYLERALTQASPRDASGRTPACWKDGVGPSVNVFALRDTFDVLGFLGEVSAARQFGVQLAFGELCIVSGLPELATPFLERAEVDCTDEQRISHVQPLVAVLYGLTQHLRANQGYSSGTDSLLAYIWDFMQRVTVLSIDNIQNKIQNSDEEATSLLETIEMDDEAESGVLGEDSSQTEDPIATFFSQDEHENQEETESEAEDRGALNFVDSIQKEALRTLLSEERSRFYGKSEGDWARRQQSFEQYFPQISRHVNPKTAAHRYDIIDFEQDRLIRAISYLRNSSGLHTNKPLCHVSESELLKFLQEKQETSDNLDPGRTLGPNYFLDSQHLEVIASERLFRPSVFLASPAEENSGRNLVSKLRQVYVDAVTVMAESALQQRRLRSSRRQRVLRTVRKKANVDAEQLSKCIAFPLSQPPGQQNFLPIILHNSLAFLDLSDTSDSMIENERRVFKGLRNFAYSLVDETKLAGFIDELVPRKTSHTFFKGERFVMEAPHYTFASNSHPFTSLPIIAEGLRNSDSNELLFAVDRWQYVQCTLRRATRMLQLSAETGGERGSNTDSLSALQTSLLREVGADIDRRRTMGINVVDPFGDLRQSCHVQLMSGQAPVVVLSYTCALPDNKSY
eukprot:gb/GECG01001390.1/.p1 GENE.gb/GECG01001390.1/~~gb/GECG01001390.1/.p1  ORF type:complete len:814 (+),score=80.59 gb/GECG01001390.1/:1-2442(+)